MGVGGCQRSQQLACPPVHARQSAPLSSSVVCLQLYGADERTTGVVPVGFGGRAQPAPGWPPGQVTPSQMILVRV